MQADVHYQVKFFRSFLASGTCERAWRATDQGEPIEAGSRTHSHFAKFFVSACVVQSSPSVRMIGRRLDASVWFACFSYWHNVFRIDGEEVFHESS